MRIVMVSKALVVGAYQRKLEELAKLPGVELTAVAPPGWRDRRGSVALQRAYTRGYDLIVAPIVFNGQYHLHFYPTACSLLRRLHPDILHVDEEPYNVATWQWLRAGQGAGARCLFFTWQNLLRRYPWPFSAIEQANFRRAACAIAGNQAAAEVLRAKGYRKAVDIVPQFGVDPEIYRPDPGAEGAIAAADGFTIGYAGGLVPEKGIDVLIRACAGLAGLDWSLQILGEGPERAALERLAAELPGTRGRVHFLGYRPSGEMPAFYRGLHALVLPSRSRPNWIEQFGRVLIEAMASGVPVVGSDSGEIPHVIGDAGVIVREGDEVELRAALAALAQAPAQRGDLARQGRARVLAHFTQAQVAAATYDVYCRALGVSGPGVGER